MEPPVALDHLPRAMLGEGPWWDAATQRLHWVDIPGRQIHRFDPARGGCETQDLPNFVSFVVVDTQGDLVVGLGDGIHRMVFGAAERTLLARPAMHAKNRFNDGICDRQGRLWAGTMHVAASRERAPTGALYRWTGTELDLVEPDIGISNGLGWSPDGTEMYFAETFAGIVWAYAYDPATGRAGDRRIFAAIDHDLGVPDGLTVDSQGRVLVALWRAGRINIYAPSGRLDDVLHLPVPCPTSCGFGGADLRTLYVTTARSDGQDGTATMPHAGCLFACRLDVPGLAEARFRG